MTIKALFPSSEPALELDFANTKALDPRVTFTRVMTGASVATFVGADGLIKTARNNVPRFEHSPTTGESLGLLVEGAATNSLWPSEPTTAASRNSTGTPYNTWAVYDGTVSSASRNTINGLEVTISSTLDNNGFVSNNAANWGGIGGGGNHATGTVASVSLFINPLTWTGNIWIGRLAQDGNDTSAARNFQLFNNGIYTGPASNLKAIFPDGTYWLHNIPWTSLSVDVSPGQFLVLFTTTPGDNVKKFWAGGFQWEAGSVSTSYIPTVASAVTRAADVATVSNANSSVFPTSAFTTVNSPFGTAGGGSTVKLVGPTIKRTAIYAGDLPQVQINALTGTGDFWRWRVLGSTFALPNFTTNGSVTVDWGDGTVQTLTTGVYTFTNGGGYHDIGFRLDSGTFFKPNINNNATYKDRVIAVGPAPASMKIDAAAAFNNCTSLRGFDGTVDVSGSTNLNIAWDRCSSLVSFPLINTANVTSMSSAWRQCSSLTSFPLINTSNVTAVDSAWASCNGLKSFPLIDTSNVTSFSNAWPGCSGLTSFPLLNSSKVTDFTQAWDGCSGLLSFPALDTNKGTTFAQTWRSCAFTSFPLINTSSATTFQYAWISCSSLATFPANMFDTTGTLVATAFSNTFNNCALTAASIENILTSLVTNGQSNITLGIQGGTNAGAAAWTANAVTAYNTLISRGWTITRNA